ncbi:MAG TPA: ABC transporter permease subunit [Beijerinckiaceae bacterium]|nr:ABC transporter permease subunit [Beijerinckiaceae bacterium]
MAAAHPIALEGRSQPRGGRARRLAQQGAFYAVLIALGASLLYNIDRNLAERGLSLSFDFLARPAGFEIAIKAIDFSPRDTYAAAALVGIVNTLLVSALAIVTATIVGFTAGAMLLSSNPILARSTQAFTELIRNTPQLLQILFVYTVILRALPSARESLSLGGAVFLNVRGLFIPAILTDPAAMPRFGIAANEAAWLCLAGLIASLFLPLARRWKTWLAGGLLAVLAGLLAAMLGGALKIETPVLRGFNFRGGVQVAPELVALWIGLAVYASGFIADMVRGAVLAVPKGQGEAAAALGLSPFLTLRLVKLPQALRILVPPLVSQYLNILKSSTLGLAIAYPEIMAVVAGTTLNQTGHAIETMLIVMVFFIATNLTISYLINVYNRRVVLRGGL